MAIFDQAAGGYDAWYSTRKGRFVDEVETALALRLSPVSPGLRVLDAGCGTGNLSLKLAGLGCQVTGIDVSEEMLALAREKNDRAEAGIDLCRMNLCHLDLPDASFEAAFSMAAFEFIEEPMRALSEMLRVVRPGGRVLIGTINRDSAWGRLYLSAAYQAESIFRFARFKTLTEMASWDPRRLAETGECLFVPPEAPEDEFNLQREQELSRTERGGFICALWKK